MAGARTVLVLSVLWRQLQLISCIRQFPVDFKFGAAVAAYQVEGAWNVSDKGESIWDRGVRTPGIIVDGTNGDIADDSYHLFRRDVEMLRELGMDFYRFSISWPRLLPTGFPNKVSEDGKRYYMELIDELLKYNIQPMVTLYHWDLPQRLQELGGWTNPYIVDWFEDYARVVFDLFADKVKLWITLNEPLVYCAFGYGRVGFGSAFKVAVTGVADLLCAKNAMLAHARAWRLFDEKYRPKHGGVAGIANQLVWIEAEPGKGEDEKLAAEEANQFFTGVFSHPIFSAEGGWPQIVKDRIAKNSMKQGYPRSRLPDFTPEEVESVKGTYDFFGFNHYTSKYIRRGTDYEIWPWLEEIQYELYADPAWSDTPSYWFHINPIGIRKSLKFVKDRYNDPIVMITENGCSSNPGLQDDVRTQYFKDYMAQVLDSIYEDGVKVTHYTAWSLMDNFEWNDGYRSRFGLYEVDYTDPNRTRTPRKSALVYKHIAKTRSIDPDYEPESLTISIDEENHYNIKGEL